MNSPFTTHHQTNPTHTQDRLAYPKDEAVFTPRHQANYKAWGSASPTHSQTSQQRLSFPTNPGSEADFDQKFFFREDSGPENELASPCHSDSNNSFLEEALGELDHDRFSGMALEEEQDTEDDLFSVFTDQEGGSPFDAQDPKNPPKQVSGQVFSPFEGFVDLADRSGGVGANDGRFSGQESQHSTSGILSFVEGLRAGRSQRNCDAGSYLISFEDGLVDLTVESFIAKSRF